jgi:hypothetical protein
LEVLGMFEPKVAVTVEPSAPARPASKQETRAQKAAAAALRVSLS